MLAGLLVTAGNLGDRVGRKRLLMFGVVGFGAMSVVAAYAPSAELLIAARAVQGIAGAALMPSTLALIRAVFTESRQRTLAVGIWSDRLRRSGHRPVRGRVLLEHFSWGSVF
jgi:DHA2 family multidrug resistance protein-like MFS transporter